MSHSYGDLSGKELTDHKSELVDILIDQIEGQIRHSIQMR